MGADDTEAALARERALWEVYRSGDRAALESVIHPRALDVGPRGPLDRDAVVAAVSRMSIVAFAIADLLVSRFGDLEIVTYRSTVDGTYDGRPFSAREVHATSVWLLSDGAWRVVHRHETPAQL